MQTANIQLSLAVKSASPSSAGTPAAGAFGQSNGSNGFDRWMAEAANRPAQIDRSKSNSLPSRGDELPASGSVSQNGSSDIKRDSDAQDASSSEVVTGSVSKDSKDVKSDNAASASEPGIEGGAVSSASSRPSGNRGQSANLDPEPESGLDAPAIEAIDGKVEQGSLETVVDVAVTDVMSSADELVDAASAGEVKGSLDGDAEQVRQQQSTSLQTTPDVLTETVSSDDGHEVPAVDNLGQQSAGNLASSSESQQSQVSQSDATVLPLEGVATAQAERQSRGTIPPGSEHASEQGIAHGRPFESLQVDNESSGESVQLSQTPDEDISLGGVSGAVEESSSVELASPLVEDVPQPDSQAAVENPQSAASVTSRLVEDLPVDSENVPGNQFSSTKENAVSDSSVVGNPAPEIARVSEAKPSISNSSNGAQTSASVANTSVAASASGAGNSGTQQSGADAQSNRQAFTDQLAQMGAAERATEKSSDARTQSGSADSQANLTKTGSPSNVPLDTATRAPLTQAQAAVAAVPPQALNRMQQAQWGQKLGERSLMMVQHGPRVAYVQLDPPELGALQVRVHLHQGDQVSLSFSAPNAAVKEAIEQHLPRLREMFAEQGLNLSQSDVRDQSTGGRDRGDQGEAGSRGRFAGSADEPEMMFTEMSVPVGAVDYYA